MFFRNRQNTSKIIVFSRGAIYQNSGEIELLLRIFGHSPPLNSAAIFKNGGLKLSL